MFEINFTSNIFHKMKEKKLFAIESGLNLFMKITKVFLSFKCIFPFFFCTFGNAIDGCGEK